MRVSVFAPPWGPTALPEDFDAVAEAAEGLGFPTLWVGDHVVFPRSVSSRYLYNESGVSPFDPDQPLLDPLGLVAYLAGRTQRIDLGISVLVLPMRNPVETAKILADIQVLSRGRLVAGVGVGWMREEFEALGATFEERGPRTDEYLAILRHLWNGDPEPFQGRYYRLPALGFAPRPDPIPIVLGGNSAAAMRRAARFEGWHAIRMSPEELSGKVAEVREMVGGNGRDPEAFRIVYRGAILEPEVAAAGPKEADEELREVVGAFLHSYRSAGVNEFIVEFPDLSTGARIAWMRWLGEGSLAGLSGIGG